jgi:hypothetical protein
MAERARVELNAWDASIRVEVDGVVDAQVILEAIGCQNTHFHECAIEGWHCMPL